MMRRRDPLGWLSRGCGIPWDRCQTVPDRIFSDRSGFIPLQHPVQVCELKEKLAKEGPRALTPEQAAKVEGEAALLAELQGLGGAV